MLERLQLDSRDDGHRHPGSRADERRLRRLSDSSRAFSRVILLLTDGSPKPAAESQPWKPAEEAKAQASVCHRGHGGAAKACTPSMAEDLPK